MTHCFAPLRPWLSRAALALAAAASAASATSASAAAPQRFSFDDIPTGEIARETTGPYAGRGFHIPHAGCMTTGVYAGSAAFPARTAPNFLAVSDQDLCGAYLTLGFTAPLGPAAVVQFALKGRLTAEAPATATIQAFDASNVLMETRTVNLGDWQTVTFRPPRPILRLFLETGPFMGPAMLVDDVLVSTATPQPNTTVTAAPPATTTSRSATVSWTINADAARATCSLDGAAATPCSGSVSYANLSVAAHTLRVTAYDHYGVADASPSIVRWTVVNPPAPTTPTPTTPRPTTPTPTTPRPTTPAPTTPTPLAGTTPLPASCGTGPDSDRDGVPDVCDTVGLPAGTPPVPGERASVAVTSGEVFVKLPGATASRLLASDPLARRSAAPDPGYVPLKGVAVIPVGSSVDARSGTVNVNTATGASAKSAPQQATSRVSAAIFQIRQRRAQRRAAGKPKKPIPPSPTELILRNPEGAIRAAQCNDQRSRSVVRSLSATVPKGIVRVSGFAAQAVAEKSGTTLRVVDRCDGTFTEVGAGKVKLLDVKRKRIRHLRGGQGYFIKGNLLQVEGRKGR